MGIITINGESPSHPGSTWWIQVIRGPGHLLRTCVWIWFMWTWALEPTATLAASDVAFEVDSIWKSAQRHCLNGWIWPWKFWAFWEHLKKLLEVNWWSLDVIATVWAIFHCHGSYCILVALSSDYSKGTQWPKVIKVCFDFLVIENLL